VRLVNAESVLLFDVAGILALGSFVATSNVHPGVKTTLAVYANTDDALLLWGADTLADDLEGFAFQRKRSRSGAAAVTEWLANFAAPGPKAHQNGDFSGSNERPIRAFSWTDHNVDTEDRVSYRVVPFLAGTTAPSMNLASKWSLTVTLAWPKAAPHRAYFNRGFVISQFVSRYLEDSFPDVDRLAALKAFKAQMSADVDDKFRAFLGGQLRKELLALLDDVKAGKHSIYGALYELADEELVARLEALGPRAHLVLSNGSIEPRKNESSEQARKRDQNRKARTRLRDAGVDVEETHRFISPGALGHNKFLVIVDAQKKAQRVWTGSTNWTTTGLCTQLNNGLLIENASVATAYLTQWEALRAAGSDHPDALVRANATPFEIGGGKPERSP
jgi:hypothetical protein